MTSKKDCPNKFVFAANIVASHEEGFNHMVYGFNKQLLDNMCPTCSFVDVCTYKDELLTNLNRVASMKPTP